MRGDPDRRLKRQRHQATVWRIFRSWGGGKPFLGIVEAPTGELAISKAIIAFEITDPTHQKHLVAEPRD